MTRENPTFATFDNSVEGLLFNDENHSKYPLKYYNLINGNGLNFEDGKSYFGYVYDGIVAYTNHKNHSVTLHKGMYFSINQSIKPEKWASGKAIVIEIQNGGYYAETGYRTMNVLGGEIEEKGRLKYIDGCTDSLLIAPVKMGDPCLNHLHFPSNIVQTPHTHPSHRIGIVARGNGECITPFGNLPLIEGMIFIIKEWNGQDYAKGEDGNEYEAGTHCFYTYDSSMDVIAFHPDSDFGPTDEVHPMINRTIVKGKKASEIEEIRTK